MKISEHWLREWINPPLTLNELCERLTMAGLEIESATSVAEKFSDVVIGKVLRVEKHPEADRLHVCEVDVGKPEKLSIVCGASNVKPDIKVAAALEGAVLANKTKIKNSKLRGVVSQGMLCSIAELGLAEDNEGIFILPPDAPVGKSVWDFLNLSDHVIEVSITPNRGDCLSVLGLTHEIAALTETKPTIPVIANIKNSISDELAITIKDQKKCPQYVGRIIRGVTADAITPIWLQERLRRSGIRCISPVVDVMNYVMLELGQPMHAFDLDKIEGDIQVRLANKGEALELLDGQTLTLDEATLLIADKKKPLAIAGVMGGLDSAVTLLTKDVFLESAFFKPDCIARTARKFNLGSDSSYRFERGVDPELQRRAIERATQLILEIAGGKPGPVTEVTHKEFLPTTKVISLRAERITKILGTKIPDQNVEAILQRLGFSCQKNSSGWDVTVPARRFDITMEIDLIEEIIRIDGYNNIPLHEPISAMKMHSRSERELSVSQLRHALCDLGYQEVVTYSFVDKKLQTLFDPSAKPKELLNPMTSEMSVMRTLLWPGLINTYLYNQNRQQSRARIFETGLRFIHQGDQLTQQHVLSGLVSGDAFSEQWGMPSRPVDFFDLKGDLENLFKLTTAANEFEFKKGAHPALHPGQTAEIYRNGQLAGIMGALHPNLVQQLDIQGPLFLFELPLETLQTAALPHFAEISKFPEIRRDLAILIDQAVPVREIQDTIVCVAGELLRDVNVFDVYQGKGIVAGRKSIALSLTLQHSSRTLVDDEVTGLVDRVMDKLKETFAAELRG